MLAQCLLQREVIAHHIGSRYFEFDGILAGPSSPSPSQRVRIRRIDNGAHGGERSLDPHPIAEDVLTDRLIKDPKAGAQNSGLVSTQVPGQSYPRSEVQMGGILKERISNGGSGIV